MQAGITVSRHDFKPYGKTQIVQLKDIDANGKLRSPLECLEKRGIKPDAFICDDDILLKARGAQIAAAHIQQAPEKTVASSAYIILRPRRDAVLPAFLAWFLNNTRLPILQSSVMRLINLKDLKGTPVPMLSLKKQAEIASIHELTKKARALFDKQQQQINHQLMVTVVQATQKAGRSEIRL
jgi:hypothetical protein